MYRIIIGQASVLVLFCHELKAARRMTQLVNVKVSHVDKMRFQGENTDGLRVTLDASTEFGGENSGLKPMEMLLVSLATCSAMDVVSIMQKKKQNFTYYDINVSGERSDEHPKVFTRISVEHVFTGANLDPKAVERAIELSSDKYCSVMAMLRKAVPVTTTYRIVNTEG